MCSGVLGTIDQLIIDNEVMDEVRNQQRNLAVAFYDYQRAYDIVRHDSSKQHEIVNKMIVKASMDTEACSRVKKCGEIVLRKGNMTKGEGLLDLEKKMEALDLDKNEIYKFLRCEQADKIDVKRVMERVKKEIRKRLDHPTGLNLNDQNMMKAINSRVVPIVGYVMNVCNLGKGKVDKLKKIVEKCTAETWIPWKTIKG